MLVTKLLYTPTTLFVLYTTDLYHLWVSIFPQKFPTILLYRNSESVCKSKDAEQNRSKTNINYTVSNEIRTSGFIVYSSRALLPRSHLNDYLYRWFLHAKLINNSRISFVGDDFFFLFFFTGGVWRDGEQWKQWGVRVVVSPVPKTTNVQIFSLFTFDWTTQRTPLLCWQTSRHREYDSSVRLA